jgi:hypothetical protein
MIEVDGVETNFEKGTADIPAEKKYIRFSIKADDTEPNQKVHAAFKQFCKDEADNNYTTGLMLLLTYYQEDGKYEALWNAIRELQEQVKMLEQPAMKKEKVSEAF